MEKKAIILFGFVIVKFLLQYSLMNAEYDLQRDEYLHLDQANHLAWGYLSVPPVTSWISVIIKMLGNSIFWIRFFPALFGALTIVVVWKTIEELNGDLFALILGAACILFSAILRINTLFQPNSLDILCWATCYFFVIKYFRTEKSKWLYIGALVFATGFLNKYNIVFLLIGLLPAIFVTPQRSLFLKQSFYNSIFVAVILVLPNLLWQYNHDFPVIHHLRELAKTQLVNVDRFEFLKNQLFFFTGSLFVIIAALYALLFYKPFEKYRSFFWTFFFTLIAFICFRAKDYYAIGLYPVYISFGTVFIAHLLKEGRKRYWRPVVIAIPVLLFIPFYMIGFPNRSPAYIIQHSKPYKDFGLLRWEDGKDHLLPQDFADMLGWQELAAKVDSVWSTLPNPDQTLVLCDNYGQAGAINYYSTNRRITAHSFNADYINWLRYDNKIIDVILVKEPGDNDKNRRKETPLFDSVFLAAQRINQFARESEISIYVLRGARVDVNRLLKEEADLKKNYGVN